MKLNDRQKTIAGLRHIADVLETHPLLPIPYIGGCFISAESLEQMIEVAKSYGGHWEKRAAEGQFELWLTITNRFQLMTYTARENVCTRVVVGTKVIPATTLPAREATYMPERVEEIVEWHCPPSLNEVAQEQRQQKLTAGSAVVIEASVDDNDMPF